MECIIQAGIKATEENVKELQDFYKQNAAKWLIENTKKGVRLKSIKEFTLTDNIVIGIFQGSKGKRKDLDIIVKYKDKFTHSIPRTIRHIHWVFDLLIKKYFNKELTLEFIIFLLNIYDKIEPFKSKEEQLRCELKYVNSEELKKFRELNQYGQYSIDFLVHVMELLSIEEKTGFEGAFMFKKVLKSICESDDIFSTVSSATHNGKI